MNQYHSFLGREIIRASALKVQIIERVHQGFVAVNKGVRRHKHPLPFGYAHPIKRWYFWAHG